ncbi:hypothetical protein CAPTEDRAFT_168983 [Capitella teleta]|uniref:V-SNARE coiled-coil homology domain-containing protein n=1 Tax=Capitella teleta TaxID=283909 RepID=R7VKT6_CAPTE|nr:hypothetical protein CAPTEDRAFT_168983 [Capitella teleta]|eukprot:ELU17045.1 hypothetical protein CAPTEDRAFT_168983 [Capitella teleta]
MPPKFQRDYSDARAPERQALLEGASDEDDFFLNGPSSRSGRMTDPKVSRVQSQVHEVVNVMQDNIGKVMDRGEKLEDLQDKSDSLSINADSFRSKARSVRSQMWWKECKMRLLMAFVIIIILLIIIVPIILRFKKD